jgi:hypothetical protein
MFQFLFFINKSIPKAFHQLSLRLHDWWVNKLYERQFISYSYRYRILNVEESRWKIDCVKKRGKKSQRLKLIEEFLVKKFLLKRKKIFHNLKRKNFTIKVIFNPKIFHFTHLLLFHRVFHPFTTQHSFTIINYYPKPPSALSRNRNTQNLFTKFPKSIFAPSDLPRHDVFSFHV